MNSYLNHKELEKTFYMQKLRIFHSFPTPYHLRQSDKPFAKNSEKTFRPRISPFFKLLLNHIELEKTIHIWKMRIFTSFPMPSYFLNSDQRFENWVQNTIHVFGFEKNGFFKTALKPWWLCKKFLYICIVDVKSFPMIY